MTFIEAEHPRAATGQWMSKVQTAPEAALPETLTPSGLDPEDIRYGVLDGCGAIALTIHERTGWPVVVLTTEEAPDGEWVHAAVELPDGRVMDVSGLSDGGQHILDDDDFYVALPDEVRESGDEPVLRQVTPSFDALVAHAIDVYDPDRVQRIADELLSLTR